MTDSVSSGAPERSVMVVDVRPSACGYSALLWALQEAERRDAQLLAVGAGVIVLFGNLYGW